MKKIWNFILKYRIYIIIVLLLVFGAFVFVTVKAFLFPEDERTVYGSRLDGIEDVAITNETKEKVISKLKETEGITEVSIDIQGKIVNILITATTEENKEDVIKEVCAKSLESFSKEEVAFYDFQFFVKNVDANYNMIGYKNKRSEVISWVIDEIVKDEDKEVKDENKE